jgi:anhydro-N-acetylmuramic acid kinase
VETLGFDAFPYPGALRALLLRNSDVATSSVRDLSQLNVRLAHEYASALLNVCSALGFALKDLDLIGTHGQTVHHVPDGEDCAGRTVASTLQIGDPSVLANLAGVPVVGDFRLADMAHGGQGAPLVPYFDAAVFGDATSTRVLLNLGGIANLTIVPARSLRGPVRAFDSGPANMLVDELCRRHFDVPFDRGGEIAGSGEVSERVLAELASDEYFARVPPKSTGRELFGSAYADRLEALCKTSGCTAPEDLVATATALTARTISDAFKRFVSPYHEVDQLVVSGGGVHNRWLMSRIQKETRPARIVTTASFGVHPDAKEALCFAVLAHETMNGISTNVPSATGASHRTILGKICLPLRRPAVHPGDSDGEPE